MDLSVIGTGTAGLLAATSFAEAGADVTCVDPDEERVRRLSSCVARGLTPEVAVLVARSLANGRLRFSSDVRDAIRSADVIFVTGGATEAETCDLDEILAVAESIGRHMDGEKVVVVLGRVPVGTAWQVRAVIEGRADHPVHVCSSSGLQVWRSRDGSREPAQVILGVQGRKAREVLAELYAPLVRDRGSLRFMDPPSAELSTWASGGRLASRMSFMDMVTRLGDAPRPSPDPTIPWSTLPPDGPVSPDPGRPG